MDVTPLNSQDNRDCTKREEKRDGRFCLMGSSARQEYDIMREEIRGGKNILVKGLVTEQRGFRGPSFST